MNEGDAPLVLPTGLLGRASTLLGRAVDVLGRLDPSPCAAAPTPSAGGQPCTGLDAELLHAHLFLPHVVAAANALEPPAAPPRPMPAPGGGWLCVDLGPDDESTFDSLCRVIEEETRAGLEPPDAEAFARRAQEWRLAVTPYRGVEASRAGRRAISGDGEAGIDALLDGLADGLADGPADGPAGLDRWRTPGAVGGRWRPLEGIQIVDLTVMWAGPLATWLLADLGADVIKIEPEARPDGFRRSARPASAGSGDGALFVALNDGKRFAPLDLRRAGDRSEFLDLVAGADVVFDNFSPRVRANLAITPEELRRVNPHLLDVSLHAFPAGGDEAGWVAYGNSVHACSGLAQLEPPRDPDRLGTGPNVAAPPFAPAVVAYPDPLAGMTAFLTVVALLAARRHGRAHPHTVELSLAGAVAPLVAQGATVTTRAELGRRDDEPVGRCVIARTVLRDGCRIVPSPLQPAAIGGAR